MKTPRPLVACLVLVASATGFAQVVPPKPPVEAETESIILSPFVVEATADHGYAASSSLAGSRLKTNLKDIAASVTVLTDDFLDDLGVSDIASAMAFVAGAENDATTDPNAVSINNQGYIGTDFGDTNGRTDEVRVRGLGRASRTNNFLRVLTPTDRYNTDRNEFLRGANSILFGLAEPAGLVNSSTKMANLRRAITKVETKVDNFGSTRTVLDLSRVLKKDVFAVRAVGLYKDGRNNIETSFDRDRRIFLAAAYAPFKGTLIRANFEKVERLGNRPNYRTIQDNVSDWLALHNQYSKVLSPTELAAAFYWDPTTQLGAPGASTAGTTALGTVRRALDGKVNATGLFFDNSNWNSPLYGGAILTGTRTATNGTGTPNRQFARSGSPRENLSGYTDPQVTNSAIFPYKTQELGTLPGNYRWDKSRTLSLSLDQRITDNFFVSAIIQREKLGSEQYYVPIAQTQQISIDINTKLPDGRTNPNFLRPFIYGRNIAYVSDDISDQFLVQANYDLDFAKKTRRLDWLGFHRLTGLYTKTKLDTLYSRWNIQVNNSRIPDVLDTALDANNRHIYQFWYIGDAVKPGDTGLRLTGLPTTANAPANTVQPITAWNNTTGTAFRSPESLAIGRQPIPGGRRYTEQFNDGLGASLQSFFWKRRVVTLLGWREDSVEQFNHTSIPNDTVIRGSQRNEYILQTVPAYKNKKPTLTQSVVFHATDWLRFFGTRSENFAATNPRLDPLYRPIAPQNGETVEYGFGLSLLQDKLNLKTTLYDSSQNLASSSNLSNAAGGTLNAFEDLVYNALVNAGRLSEWSTFGPSGTTKAAYDSPVNPSSTENTKSKGWDVEVVYNPTRNWRISMSMSKLENRASNVAGELGEFLGQRAAFYSKYFKEGLRRDGTNAASPVVSNSPLLQTDFANGLARTYVDNINREGAANVGVSKNTVTLVSRYSFSRNVLKGLSVGGNLRWDGGKIFGYQQKDFTYNVGGLENFPGRVSDLDRPFDSGPVVSGGMQVGYSRKIFNGRVQWRAQLNAQNLFSERGLRQIRVNPDASPVWAILRPLVFELSNTFEF